ncbi:MAG: TonB-dependent receptor [Chitinophagaceae bacterium]|nr:MAG: TonB-dependent receptor [Chitinophagaceae bacterium]
MKHLLFPAALIAAASANAQQGTLQGRLTGPDGAPVPAATVQLLNTGHQALSDANGRFVFRGVRPGTYTLVAGGGAYASILRSVEVREDGADVALSLPLVYRHLDEVVISSRRWEETLQRSPLSVTALSARKVEEYRLWNAGELSAFAPNLYTADPGDQRNVTSLRGIVTTSYDPAVATYVDGVNQFGLDTYIPQLFDVERIEVLRGPQGTLYGRNAMGGVIHIITKRPGTTPDGMAEVSVGNYGRQRYSLSYRTPISRKLFIGGAGLFDKTDGYYTNTVGNSKYDRQSSAAANWYLRYEPAAGWSITLNAKHAHNRNHGPFPLVFGAEEALADPFKLSQNAVTKMIDNVFNGSLALVHAGPRLQWSSQTAYQSNYRYYNDPIDADFSPLNGMTIINNYGREWNRNEVFTQEFNLRPTGDRTGLFRWSAGAFLFHQKAPVKQTTRFGEDAEMLGAPQANFSLINSTTSKATGAAVYGEVGLPLTRTLELSAGLRYDHERRSQQILGEYQADPDPNPQFAYRPDTSAAANFSALSPRVGLSFRPSASHLLFATYSKGFRPGGLTPLSSDPSQPALFPFDPEYSHNIEVGVKNDFAGGRLAVNLTLFATSIRGAQLPTLILPDAVVLIRNTGEMKSRGAEIELRALPVKGLSVEGSFGYTHARYGAGTLAHNGEAMELKGKRQVFTPEYTSLLGVQYRQAIGPKERAYFLVRADWRAIGEQYFDLANSIRQKPYDLLGASAGFGYRKFELLFWTRNLGDSRYISYAYDFGAVHLGAPRTLGATARVRW